MDIRLTIRARLRNIYGKSSACGGGTPSQVGPSATKPITSTIRQARIRILNFGMSLASPWIPAAGESLFVLHRIRTIPRPYSRRPKGKRIMYICSDGSRAETYA